MTSKNEKKPAPAIDSTVDSLVEKFAESWGDAADAVRSAAFIYNSAVRLVGQKEAFARFDKRFGLGKYNFDLLNDIGSGAVDVRVWFLPRYMHGIRDMAVSVQSQIFGEGTFTVYKFASEKPKLLSLGQMNQSDWRVLFEREKLRFRTGEEMLLYIRRKKREFKEARHWKLGSRKGTVVFDHACTLTKKQLQEILDLL